MRHPRGGAVLDTLAEILLATERGKPPPADGGLTVVPAPSPRDAVVLAFTAHHVIAVDLDPVWVRATLPPGDLCAPLNPPFLTALCERLDRRVNNIDLVAIAEPLTGSAPVPVRQVTNCDHPRAVRALRYRDEVSVWTTDGGVVLVGRGVAGRWEMAVEVEPGHRGRGLGRQLAVAARHLVPEHRPLWAQIAPGNAASVRAFLAAGYVPVGAEALLVR